MSDLNRPTPPFKRSGTTITTRTATDIVDLSLNTTKVKDAVGQDEAINLGQAIELNSISLNYWLSNAVLSETLTDSEAALLEVPDADPKELGTITFKSTAAQTPTPFTINEGTIIDVHFAAKVTVTAAKKSEQLYFKLGYVDADGTSNFTQIGADSDSTAVLTATKTTYASHIHVGTTITVPAGKRLWLKVFADATGAPTDYPEINFYYDAPEHHIVMGIASSVLANYLPLKGGTMTGKTVTAGTTEVGKTYTPATGAQNVTIDCSVNNIHHVTGHADGTAITFLISNATSSQPFLISILQGAVVSTISAWFATVRWAGGSAPTLTATINKRDTFRFIRTGADTYDGFVVGQNC